jgi:hypothetical protein
VIKEALEKNVSGRVLLVLDGLEKVQCDGRLAHGVRGTLRPEAMELRELLIWTASRAQDVWVIVTSRFPLIDLIDWQGHGYTSVVLDRLSTDAARALLGARGVRGSNEELDQLSEEFGCHPLTLTLLGGLLSFFWNGDPKRVAELPLREKTPTR